MIFIDSAVSKDCINIHSYGMICVGCGCCSRNPNYRDMIIRRIRYYLQQLHDEQHFDEWSENERLRKIQEENVKSNILYYKRKIRRNKQILRTLKKTSSE